jgi:hypothetical protein
MGWLARGVAIGGVLDAYLPDARSPCKGHWKRIHARMPARGSEARIPSIFVAQRMSSSPSEF